MDGRTDRRMDNVKTAYICKLKEENLPKLSVYRIWRKFLRTQECVRLIHGKQAIRVRAIEVLLYNVWKKVPICYEHYHTMWHEDDLTLQNLLLHLTMSVEYKTESEEKNHFYDTSSRKHAYIVLTPLNPTFI